MNGRELLQKIDLLIEHGNMAWENPGKDATQDIALFCDAVKDLVLEIHGADHPYIKKHAAAAKDMKHDLGDGMMLLQSIRKEVEKSS